MIRAAIHGFILAFPLIMPLGAQNVFVFNQGASNQRFSRVLPVIITAGLCDTLLILLAVMGISLIIFKSFWIKTFLLGVGILFLIYMGWITWRSNPSSFGQDEVYQVNPKKQILFSLSVSLLNPHAIMDTVGVIGINSAEYAGLNRAAFTIATIFVSWIWFFGLAWTGRVTGKLDKSGYLIRLLNRISAVIMWGAACYMGYLLLK